MRSIWLRNWGNPNHVRMSGVEVPIPMDSSSVFFIKSQIWVSLTLPTHGQVTVRVGNDQNRPPPCTRGSVVVIPANPYESQNNEIPNRRGGTMKHFLTRNPYQSKINEIPNRRGGTMKHILTRNRYRNTFSQNLRFGSP